MVISNTVVALIVGAITVSNFIGGLVMKAFIKPLETAILANEINTSDHETRLRDLEAGAQRTQVHIETLTSDIDSLVKKLDQLITIQLNRGDRYG